MSPKEPTPEREDDDNQMDHDDQSEEGEVAEGEEDDVLGDLDLSEFTALDRDLDAFHSVLDEMERRNDELHNQLKQMLQDSREERMKQTQEQQPGQEAQQ